jgi:hypothetical protein
LAPRPFLKTALLPWAFTFPVGTKSRFFKPTHERVKNFNFKNDFIFRGRFFVHFFRGKFRGNFSTKNVGENFEFSAEKVLKNCFPKKFRGKLRGKSLSTEKMYKKSATGVNRLKPVLKQPILSRYTGAPVEADLETVKTVEEQVKWNPKKRLLLSPKANM